MRAHGGWHGSSSRRAAWVAARVIGAAAVVACALIAMPTDAHAAAVFDSQYPAPSAVVTFSPASVSVHVDDASAIDGGSFITFDGVPMSTSVVWDGHVEDPDCEAIWVVDDWTAATLSVALPPLQEGVHTVAVTVYTASSGTSTTSWTFTVDYEPAAAAIFTGLTPIPDTTVTAPSVIRTSISAPVTIYPWACQLLVDGVVTPLYSSGAGTFISIWTPAYTITDGPHTVLVKALDSRRVYTEKTWSFNAAVLPLASTPVPASGSSVTVPRPQIGLNVSDNTPGPVNLRLRLNGAQVFNGPVPQGAFRWTPTSDLVNGSNNTVIADVTDSIGLTRSLTWSFRAEARPPMSTGGDCTSCHDANAHPFSNCAGCHADDPLYDPHDSNRYAPLGECGQCHGMGPHSGAYVSDCNWCHASPVYTYIPRHASEASVTAKHLAPASECTTCHDAATITEHGKYPKDSPFKYQCFTCHASARPEVVAAIAANDPRCETCHPGTDHLASHVSPTSAGCFGAGCHDPSRNLAIVHERYAGPGSPHPEYDNSCGLCHENPAVNTSTSGKSCTPACHSISTHSGYAAAHTVPGSSAECTACHTANLSGIHGAGTDFARCAVCHETVTNWTKTAACADCHAGIDHVAAHASSLATDCRACHDANVALQHVSVCDTCHASADARVSGAIDDHDLACEACHDAVEHDSVHDSDLASQCQECHDANLLDQHVDTLGLTCDACHADGATMAAAAQGGAGGASADEPQLPSPTPFAASARLLGSGGGESVDGSGGTASDEVFEGVGVNPDGSLAGPALDAGAPGAEPPRPLGGGAAQDIHDAIDDGNTSCPACHTSIHGSLDESTFATGFPGYLSWATAQTFPGNTTDSPHGGYISTTNKCAVCHSVHRAKVGGAVLTAFGPYASYAQGCLACHSIGSTFTDAQVVAFPDGSISPHGSCDRCHTVNPHGIGASEYAVLAQRLLGPAGDAFIGSDIAAAANGAVAADFAGTADATRGVALGTGYLCSSCHEQSFAVGQAGADPAGGGTFSGHHVYVDATTDYTNASTVYGSQAGAVAWNSARGCSACHDALAVSGRPAFPHGYVDASGAVTSKTTAGASYVWLTLAEDALGTGSALLESAGDGVATTPESAAVELLTQDGLCLKCHRAGNGTSGVGLSY